MKIERIALVAFENEMSWGLRSIAQFLRSYGYKVELYFLERYSNQSKGVSNNTLHAFIKSFNPGKGDVVGISFMTPYLGKAISLCKMVSSFGAILVAGGIHPTIHPEDCLSFDYVIRGTGEFALLELVEALQFCFYGALSTLPYPRYGEQPDYLIEHGRVRQSTDVPRKVGGITRYQTFTAFGCPYQCAYCVNPILQQLSGRYGKNFIRYRDTETVLDELRSVKSRVDTISFEDEDFFLDSKRIIHFLERYRTEIGLPFTCLVHPLTIKFRDLEGLASRLKDAGCVGLTVGLQSGSARTNKLFHRSFNRQWLMTVAKAFSRRGIKITYDVILDNPFEDESDVDQTVDVILSLPRPFEVNVFYLTFFPGYLITDKAKEMGLLTSDSMDTRSTVHKSGLAEWVIRLAQVPFIPRSLLRWLYDLRASKSIRLLSLILPVWENRMMKILRLGLAHPGLIKNVLLNRKGN